MSPTPQIGETFRYISRNGTDTMYIKHEGVGRYSVKKSTNMYRLIHQGGFDLIKKNYKIPNSWVRIPSTPRKSGSGHRRK